MHPPRLEWPILYLVRGLPGTGKTTLAKTIAGIDKTKCLAADDYFYENLGAHDAKYTFDPAKLPEAHKECLLKTSYWLTEGYSVVVHNTFSCRWEMEPYLQKAKAHNFRVTVLDLFDAGLTDDQLAARGLHDVPVETITKMRNRWEHDWGDANPLPPWERTRGSRADIRAL